MTTKKTKKAKKIVLVAALLAIAALISTQGFAGNSTVTYTAGQSNAIQNRVIPALNAERCGNFGLPASCTSAQVAAAGCVAETFKGVAITGCTIYSQDATGEQALLQLLANQALAQAFAKQNTLNEASFKALCSAASASVQDTLCTTVGAAAGCNPCP